MKAVKILSACALSLLMASGAVAYEATAKITMEGSLINQTHKEGNDSEYKFLSLDPITDKSKNGIEFDVDGGVAGAHFELFYIIDGGAKAEDGWKVSARKTHLWFTPIDQLKFRIGYVGDDSFFCERVDEEKVGNPFRHDLRGDGLTYPEYITNADVDDMGFSVAVTPIEQLTFSAAVAPGVGTAAYTLSGDESDGNYSEWGLGAKFAVNDNLSIQAAYRDNGKESWKVLRAGIGYESENVYAFFQPVFGIEYAIYESKPNAYEMNGICFDVYGEFNLDAWKFIAHLPVTVRTTGNDGDSNYMEALLLAKYNLGILGLLDDFTPYLKLESWENVWLLDDNFSDSMNLNIQPGVEFKIGECEIDVGFSALIHSKNDGFEKFSWGVPFTAKMKF